MKANYGFNSKVRRELANRNFAKLSEDILVCETLHILHERYHWYNTAAEMTAECVQNNNSYYEDEALGIPQSVIEEQEKRGDRLERDRKPYRLWIEQGYMRTCDGNKCDKQIFYDWFEELRTEGLYMSFIAYDPWHIDDSLLARFHGMVGKNNMLPIRQGAKTLSQPMKDLKHDLQAHKIIYNNNPVLKTCLLNTNQQSDINGNIQPVKNGDPRNRIDGTIALLCAYTALKDKRDKYVNLNYGVK